ncbi:MAG: metallophosphoesterase family protein [Burkholderiaceae bacterium]|nr:metallophosphoesterase family protein [Burkholderiaceae bacterium]
MKVCIVSDSHDRAPMLAAAVSAAKRAGAAAVIHCGDLIGASTLAPLIALGLPVHAVHGNNLGDAMALWRLCARSGGLLHYHGADAELELAGRRIFVTHYPHYARGIASTGDYDIVCCGHSHRASVARQPTITGATTWLVNPGTVAGLSAPPTWILGDLQAPAFEIRTLE